MKLIFVGPPGAGKGTLSKQVSTKYSIPQISTGDIFREAIKNGTPLGKKVKEIMDSGKLVPDEVTIGLVKERLSQSDVQNGYILDGFPRTVPQAEALATFQKVSMVISLDIEDDTVIIERLSGRRTCKSCGAIFHVKNNPPSREGICDKCGNELFIRDDDKIPSIKKRLEVYREKTEPLINYYREQGLLRSIDASKAPEEVFKEFTQTVGN